MLNKEGTIRCFTHFLVAAMGSPMLMDSHSSQQYAVLYHKVRRLKATF